MQANNFLKGLTTASLLLTSSLLLIPQLQANEFELSGKVAIEQRKFFSRHQFNGQFKHSQASILIEPELYWNWNDGDDSLIFKPFYRLDEQDDNRSHGDIREFSYIHASDDWELRAGIRKVFWGVTEFQHLVDVINQTDSVEDIDGEDKLGQLMLNLSLVRDWGIVDLYVLPGFRERTFGDKKSRLRGPYVVDTDNIEYQSSAQEQHVDLVARWSHSLGDVDFGTYWFHGTNRDPIITLEQRAYETENDALTEQVLTQYYSQMDQFGLDIQMILDDWLWKFETIYRDTQFEDYWATQSGFEYSFIGVFDSAIDVGLLMEYSWDSRGEGKLDKPGANFQNDVFFGTRLAFNDMQSSAVLVGFSADLDHNAFSFLVEANRRLGDNYKVSVDVRLFQSNSPLDQLYSLKNDDHAQLSIEWYF
ncbi:MAG: hypothetical protein ACI9LM_004176 [Alteromonadaceae bacterium]|jgi:hypothetical protein